MSHPQTGSAGHTAGAHETRDLPSRPIVVTIVGGVVVTVAIFAALYVFTAALERYVQHTSPPPNPLAGVVPKEPPAPRLQPAPIKDLQELRAWEDSQLHHYGWVDKANGIVRIPIERAIDLLAEKGLPARPEEPQP
ncbi:MAG: hypothetical protein N3C12_06725 [Candidatus Binatia bacterium]|nr:hypothetical protein [Candidatus Binatia bacterium]